MCVNYLEDPLDIRLLTELLLPCVLQFSFELVFWDPIDCVAEFELLASNPTVFSLLWSVVPVLTVPVLVVLQLFFPEVFSTPAVTDALPPNALNPAVADTLLVVLELVQSSLPEDDDLSRVSD